VTVSQLLLSLPVDPTNAVIKEAELITGYLMPALKTLFDDDGKHIRMRWMATEPLDGSKSTIASRWPDCLITMYPEDTDDGVNIGYGEAKRESERRNHYLINQDLIRLALFTKKTVDDTSFDTSASLAIHAIGATLTFYLLKIQADGLYIMTELAHLDVPMAVSEIPSFL
ncbi:hypothetical protein BDB00DRAFT_750969, partial [Zychaea mexicana]|uniref:uncharacterized protein n=1 Tax=Zychaea mexicana TaxID=64656 RepID=UPI0022FDF6C0